MRCFGYCSIVFFLAVSWPALPGLPAKGSKQDAPPFIIGRDHLSDAVRDLDAAAEQYRRPGFVLKPGRHHPNGLRNQHARFPDGTEINLISAGEARGPLAAEYLRHIASGDGAAFVSFCVRDMIGPAGWLDAAGKVFRREGGILSFSGPNPLRYIFFGQRNSSPTDKSEYFSIRMGPRP